MLNGFLIQKWLSLRIEPIFVYGIVLIIQISKLFIRLKEMLKKYKETVPFNFNLYNFVLEGKTEVIVNEGNNIVSYTLDEPLIDFGFAIESGDLEKVFF